eukprot:15237261-Alexandrium_andersonii.AAC.1
MSASLVGSEMCIRDRAHTPGATGRRIRRPRTAPGSARGARDGTTCTASVSYTHLTLPTICSV